MKKVKCVNGHTFDIERYSTCPFCGAAVARDEPAPEGKKTTDKVRHTVSIFHEGVDELAPTAQLQTDDQNDLENNNNTKDKEPAAPPRSDNKATDSKDTTALPKSVTNYRPGEDRPPVGWLVCVKGEYAGCAFECKTGRNRIGRDEDMEICLFHDASISRDIHAIIIYEPKQRLFYLQVGTSDGLTYLNGDYLFDHSELHAFDKIELGKAEFLFLPLCGEKFTWDDYIKRD